MFICYGIYLNLCIFFLLLPSFIILSLCMTLIYMNDYFAFFPTKDFSLLCLSLLSLVLLSLPVCGKWAEPQQC